MIPESEDKGAGRTKADKYEAKAEMKRKRAAEKAAEEAGGVKRRKVCVWGQRGVARLPASL